MIQSRFVPVNLDLCYYRKPFVAIFNKYIYMGKFNVNLTKIQIQWKFNFNSMKIQLQFNENSTSIQFNKNSNSIQ